jgi:phosphate transport system substrate-binding protein
MAVSPIVATLVLIVVAVIGAVAVGTIMGTFSSDVSKQANSGDAAGASSTEILIAGSTTVQPASEELAKTYMEAHPGVKITVQAGGSGAGVSSVGMGIVDIGSASRAISDAEKTSYPDLNTYQIGGSAVVFITNDAATIANATKAELIDAYANQSFTGNLSTIDGAYQRSEASGTEDTVSKYLLGSDTAMNSETAVTGQVGNAGMLNAVKADATTPFKLGFVDLGYALDSTGAEVSGIDIIPVIDSAVTGQTVTKAKVLTALKENKQGLTKTTQSDSYPVDLVRPLNYMVKGTPSSVVKNYITFCQSPGSVDEFNAAGMFGLSEFS